MHLRMPDALLSGCVEPEPATGEGRGRCLSTRSDGERFDPETTRLLGLAFEFTVQALHSAIHLTDGIAIQTCVGRGQSVIRVLRQVAHSVGRSRGPWATVALATEIAPGPFTDVSQRRIATAPQPDKPRTSGHFPHSRPQSAKLRARCGHGKALCSRLHRHAKKQTMTDRAPNLRSRVKSDLIALGSLSFMAGSLAITALVLVRGDLLGWVYAATAAMCVGGAIFVGRRIFSRIP